MVNMVVGVDVGINVVVGSVVKVPMITDSMYVVGKLFASLVDVVVAPVALAHGGCAVFVVPERS